MSFSGPKCICTLRAGSPIRTSVSYSTKTSPRNSKRDWILSTICQLSFHISEIHLTCFLRLLSVIRLFVVKVSLFRKCFFGVFDFFKKMNENKLTWGIILVKLNLFVHFWKNHWLGKIMTTLSDLYESYERWIVRYCKVTNSSRPHLVAIPKFFRMFIKNKFDPYLLCVPLGKSCPLR